jgi:glycerophosphoryl diester phosphodiesterase
VRLSSDGVPVICHDPQAGGRVIAKTVAAELALPRLEDVLIRYQSSAWLDIELKVGGLERTFIDLLSHHAPQRGFVVSSFLPDVLKTLHELTPSIPLGLICETKAQLALWSKLPLEYVIPHHKLLLENLVKEIHRAGRKTFVWTVNNEKDMQRLATWGVDGIISDDAMKLARAFRGRAS